MKKIGILGGLAWPSTAAYYTGICRLAEAHHAPSGRTDTADMPEIAIESLDIGKAIALFGNDDDDASWGAFDAYHRAGLQRLERSGAEFAVIACNTAHHRFAQITRGIAMPVLSIIEIAAAACAQRNAGRVLMLGTTQMMRSRVLREVFSRHGTTAAAPRSRAARQIVIDIIEALKTGHIEGAAERIRAVAGTGRPGAPTFVYLGCTELPLAFPEYQNEGVFEIGDTHFINSTALHVRAAFDYAVRQC